MKNFYTISGIKIERIELPNKFDIRFVAQKHLASHGEAGQKEIARRQAIVDRMAA